MSIKRNIVKACCGNSQIIIETDKPIRKSQVNIFRESGYFIPDSFYQAGIFYIQSKQLIVSASFGSTRFNLRCSGSDCEAQISSFETLLQKAILL